MKLVNNPDKFGLVHLSKDADGMMGPVRGSIQVGGERVKAKGRRTYVKLLGGDINWFSETTKDKVQLASKCKHLLGRMRFHVPGLVLMRVLVQGILINAWTHTKIVKMPVDWLTWIADKHQVVSATASVANVVRQVLRLPYKTPCRFLFGALHEGGLAVPHPARCLWVRFVAEMYSAMCSVHPLTKRVTQWEVQCGFQRCGAGGTLADDLGTDFDKLARWGTANGWGVLYRRGPDAGDRWECGADLSGAPHGHGLSGWGVGVTVADVHSVVMWQARAWMRAASASTTLFEMTAVHEGTAAVLRQLRRQRLRMQISRRVDNQSAAIKLQHRRMESSHTDLLQRIEAHDELQWTDGILTGWAPAQHDTGCNDVVWMVNKVSDAEAEEVRLMRLSEGCVQHAGVMERPCCSRGMSTWFVMSADSANSSASGEPRRALTVSRCWSQWLGQMMPLMVSCSRHGTDSRHIVLKTRLPSSCRRSTKMWTPLWPVRRLQGSATNVACRRDISECIWCTGVQRSKGTGSMRWLRLAVPHPARCLWVRFVEEMYNTLCSVHPLTKRVTQWEVQCGFQRCGAGGTLADDLGTDFDKLARWGTANGWGVLYRRGPDAGDRWECGADLSGAPHGHGLSGWGVGVTVADVHSVVMWRARAWMRAASASTTLFEMTAVHEGTAAVLRQLRRQRLHMQISRRVDNQSAAIKLQHRRMESSHTDLLQRIEAHDELQWTDGILTGWAPAQHDTGCNDVVWMVNKVSDAEAEEVRLMRLSEGCVQHAGVMERPCCSRGMSTWFVMSADSANSSASGEPRRALTVSRCWSQWLGQMMPLMVSCSRHGTDSRHIVLKTRLPSSCRRSTKMWTPLWPVRRLQGSATNVACRRDISECIWCTGVQRSKGTGSMRWLRSKRCCDAVCHPQCTPAGYGKAFS